MDDAAIERAARAIYDRIYAESDMSVYPPGAVAWEDASTVARGESVQLALAVLRVAGETP